MPVSTLIASSLIASKLAASKSVASTLGGFFVMPTVCKGSWEIQDPQFRQRISAKCKVSSHSLD